MHAQGFSLAVGQFEFEKSFWTLMIGRKKEKSKWNYLLLAHNTFKEGFQVSNSLRVFRIQIPLLLNVRFKVIKLCWWSVFLYLTILDITVDLTCKLVCCRSGKCMIAYFSSAETAFSLCVPVRGYTSICLFLSTDEIFAPDLSPGDL